MFRTLIEWIFPHIIGVYHHRESLSQKEWGARKAYMESIEIPERKTSKQVVVAMLGLVGSGKSSVAEELARHIGATVVNSDDIRVTLRKHHAGFGKARAIAEDAMVDILKQSGNVVLDSDHIDPNKRASVRKKIQGTGGRLIFIRTFCDLDVMIGRAMTAQYVDSPDDFFGGAGSHWPGDQRIKGAVVKVREALRRTPHHYRWESGGGGSWKLRKLPFKLFADIATGDESTWMDNISNVASEIKNL